MQSSIVIPVFNQWSYTEQCLLALHSTLPLDRCEVIVIDNCSQDQTPEECPILGRSLFGTHFVYHRADKNLNFGPASNLGVSLAQGEYIILLNNDTVPLDGWYAPLLRDFSQFPRLAATGPLLVYPDETVFGRTVQHLGIAISPILSVGHLYEGIPAASPLARKRRFFQAITAACMMMPRNIFLQFGGFDECYTNGFEDVDLCARLHHAGYLMSVNPEAVVVHHTGQSSGRNDNNSSNAECLAKKSIKYFTPDWHTHAEQDSLIFALNDWLYYEVRDPRPATDISWTTSSARSIEVCRKAIINAPYDKHAYQDMLAVLSEKPVAKDLHDTRLMMLKLMPSAETAFEVLSCPSLQSQEKEWEHARTMLASCCNPFEGYIAALGQLNTWAKENSLEFLYKQTQNLVKKTNTFKKSVYLPFLHKVYSCLPQVVLPPAEPWAYNVWQNGGYGSIESTILSDGKAGTIEEPASAPDSGTSFSAHLEEYLDEGPQEPFFSILMPVYNPNPIHLQEAVASVISQTYYNWELCLVDDASTDRSTHELILQLSEKEARIRHHFRGANGNIAAATNSALEMATGAYCVLMDQDDTLAPHALQLVAAALTTAPEAQLIYSDEDKIADEGFFYSPYLKKHAWDWELLTGQNFVSHIGVYKTKRLRAIGGFRSGFEGAQDYEMLLRFVDGLEDKQIIHIPQVLYHWRAHSGSTAKNVSVKAEALESSVKALQEHLDRHGGDGQASIIPGTQFYALNYTLPSPHPMVSIIINTGDSLAICEALARALAQKTQYNKYELIFVHDAASNDRQRTLRQPDLRLSIPVRFIEVEQGTPLVVRLNKAAEAAYGKILGFLATGVIPDNAGWLKDIVSRCVREKTGTVGGHVYASTGALAHSGYEVDAEKQLVPIFCGQHIGRAGYFSWARLVRTVKSVGSYCLFTRKELFINQNGFATELDQDFAHDYCFRLRDEGFRSIITPHARFFSVDESIVENTLRHSTGAAFYKRWGHTLYPCHPNLAYAQGQWVLAKNVSKG